MKTTFFVKDLTVKYKFLKYRGDLGFPSDNHEHRYLLVMLLQDQARSTSLPQKYSTDSHEAPPHDV